MGRPPEFSADTRRLAIERMRTETFDLLVVGGGITGAAVARDAASRGLKVALVEKGDFASGTSSKSSKLIHGGLRYLERLELGLVFEALAERTHLLKTSPHLVRPLPFYLPVYRGARNGRFIVALGLWLYDLLSLFRTPGMHRRLSARKLLSEIPTLKAEGLRGGFRYFDASMWDDVMCVETARSAHAMGVATANYLEAVRPIEKDGQVRGWELADRYGVSGTSFDVRATRTVVCAGPWTDLLGSRLSSRWKHWLQPSKGVHLVFKLERVPVPGALVMTHPVDGRVSFVIPRADMGPGLVIVGTTDGPSPKRPEDVGVEASDVRYLLDLLALYLPGLKLTEADIVSSYVGIRPLFADLVPTDATGAVDSAEALQKVSREHHIDRGPGGTVLVAGGKYTTSRQMAEEVVNFTLKAWREDVRQGLSPEIPKLGRSRTRAPINPLSTERDASSLGALPPGDQELVLERYGGAAAEVAELDRASGLRPFTQIRGFPLLRGAWAFAQKYEMALHFEDFAHRRQPLALAGLAEDARKQLTP